MDEILHHLRNQGKPFFVVVYSAVILSGFLCVWLQDSGVICRGVVGNKDAVLDRAPEWI